ncbi:MAG TPA: ATP-grasp domain-containing protein [Streptosporangiaceae bacterium]|nr:ATP-grasp domain-containing protein [Streptosporangiaceae bacterium]
MHILVMHRVPDSFVLYAKNIDHTKHDVTYVSVPDRWATLPEGVPARRLERPGTGDTAAEVLAAVSGLPRPDLVIALSEYDLIPAGRVREALGVPGDTERDVLPTRDKVVMKSAVAAAGLRAPRFMPLSEALATGTAGVPWHGPTVLKPRAGASSEGISTHTNVAAALTAACREDSLASPDTFEIEEYVEGPIIHVDGLLTAGEPVAIQASRYINTCLGYAQGTPLGSVQVDTGPAVVDWALRCLRAVGIKNGPFHLEGIESAEGLVFLEVGARAGGADVPGTFELATGVHMISAQIRCLIEGSAARPPARVPEPDERYGWFVVPGHTLGTRYCRISGEQMFRDDPLVWRWVQRQPDEPVKDVITYADSDIPLAGIVGPAPAPVLEDFLTRLFKSVEVQPYSPPETATAEASHDRQ